MQSEKGRVTRNSMNEKEVRMRAHTPGPSGSAVKSYIKQEVKQREDCEEKRYNISKAHLIKENSKRNFPEIYLIQELIVR